MGIWETWDFPGLKGLEGSTNFGGRNILGKRKGFLGGGFSKFPGGGTFFFPGSQAFPLGASLSKKG